MARLEIPRAGFGFEKKDFIKSFCCRSGNNFSDTYLSLIVEFVSITLEDFDVLFFVLVFIELICIYTLYLSILKDVA